MKKMIVSSNNKKTKNTTSKMYYRQRKIFIQIHAFNIFNREENSGYKINYHKYIYNSSSLEEAHRQKFLAKPNLYNEWHCKHILQCIFGYHMWRNTEEGTFFVLSVACKAHVVHDYKKVSKDI